MGLKGTSIFYIRYIGFAPEELGTMSDDKRNSGQPDRSKINMNEDYEVRYWTQQLNVSREELQLAVDLVGNSVEAVRKQLGKSGLNKFN